MSEEQERITLLAWWELHYQNIATDEETKKFRSLIGEKSHEILNYIIVCFLANKEPDILSDIRKKQLINHLKIVNERINEFDSQVFNNIYLKASQFLLNQYENEFSSREDMQPDIVYFIKKRENSIYHPSESQMLITWYCRNRFDNMRCINEYAEEFNRISIIRTEMTKNAILLLYISYFTQKILTIEEDTVFDWIKHETLKGRIDNFLSGCDIELSYLKEEYRENWDKITECFFNYLKKLFITVNTEPYTADKGKILYKEFYYNLEACLENAKKDKNKRVLEKKGIN